MVFTASYVLLWAAVILLLVLSLRLMVAISAVGGASEEGLPAGTAVPEFEAVDLVGERHFSRGQLPARSALVFVSPVCTTCHRIVAGLRIGDESWVVLVCRGGEKGCGALRELSPANIPLLLDPDGAIAERCGVRVTPAGLIVSDSRVLRFMRPRSASELRAALRSSVSSEAQSV
jgi:hypothetical protein